MKAQILLLVVVCVTLYLVFVVEPKARKKQPKDDLKVDGTTIYTFNSEFLCIIVARRADDPGCLIVEALDFGGDYTGNLFYAEAHQIRPYMGGNECFF